MSSSLKLELTISGQIGKFPVAPLLVTYEISGQDAATGPKAVKVPSAAAANSVVVLVEPMAEQNLLLICTDKKVTYQLNGDGVNREINEDGFAIHPGDPVITSLAFGGNGTNDADVFIFQLGVPT